MGSPVKCTGMNSCSLFQHAVWMGSASFGALGPMASGERAAGFGRAAMTYPRIKAEGALLRFDTDASNERLRSDLRILEFPSPDRTGPSAPLPTSKADMVEELEKLGLEAWEAGESQGPD